MLPLISLPDLFPQINTYNCPIALSIPRLQLPHAKIPTSLEKCWDAEHPGTRTGLDIMELPTEGPDTVLNAFMRCTVQWWLWLWLWKLYSIAWARKTHFSIDFEWCDMIWKKCRRKDRKECRLYVHCTYQQHFHWHLCCRATCPVYYSVYWTN